MKLSNRILSMSESPIRKLVPLAQAAKKRGKKVYHLNIGQPDIETPSVFFEAIQNFKQPVLEYAFSQGSPELIDAVRDYYQRIGITYQADEVIITYGGSEAIMFSIVATCDHGDEILVAEPYYTNYRSFALPYGVDVIPITTTAETGFSLPDKATLERKITDRTRAILLSNPGNPTGAVYSKEEVEMVAQLAIENDLFVVADEVYREFAYDGLEVTSFGSLPQLDQQLIMVDSISKRFSACGARIGFIASKNRQLMKQVMKLAQARLCVPTLEMVGATALYRLDPSYFDPIREEYQARRDIMLKALQDMPGVLCKVPKGAFYAVAKLPVDNAEKFAEWLLNDFEYEGETVMVAPAEGFYATAGLGVQEVRIAYVLNTEDLVRAMEVLAQALKVYPGKI